MRDNRGLRSGWDGPRIAGTGVAFRLLIAFFLLASRLGYAQSEQPSEYQVKAAFLYNFAKFVQWPAATFPAADSPIVIGVLGRNDFDDALERVLHGKSIDSHPVILKLFKTVEEVTNCHVLFISTSEKGRLDKTLAGLKASNILTVSETDAFIPAGGMINFVLQDNRVRFEINNDAAEKAGLKISSKLLSLAIRKS